MGGQVKYGGSWYGTERQAADAWAHGVLPEADVIGRGEDPETAAAELEAFCWREADRIGEHDVPEDLDADDWRRLCREALVRRISESRTAAVAS
jgi:predicted phage gp36 major capsid-like protein